MVRSLIEFGVLNTTAWAAAAALVVVLLRRSPRPTWRGWWVVAGLLVAGTAVNLGGALYRAYTAPRDEMQDIVSAREFLAGRSMYPVDMTDRIRQTLAEEGRGADDLPPPAADARATTLGQHWVQAHPPAATLALAPVVAAFGVAGAQTAVALVEMAAFALTFALLASVFRPFARGWQWVIGAAVLLGWGSVVSVFRLGQWDLTLLALVTLSWYYVRHDRPVLGGVAVGLAVTLKLVPGVVLLVFLARHRRAFWSAVGMAGVLFALTVATTGWGTFEAYADTAAGVADEYAGYGSNLSLLGFLTRGGRSLGLTPVLARRVWFLAAGGIAAGLGWLLWPRRARALDLIEVAELVDWEFAVAGCLIPVLSPVAWDHYLTFLILPVAVLAARLTGRDDHRGRVALLAMLVFLAVPETTYLQLTRLCFDAGLGRVAVWVVEPLRLYLLLGLAGWLAARLAGATHPPPVPVNHPEPSPALEGVRP